MSHDDYRYLVESALRAFAAGGEAARACALRMLAELRKRVAFCDLGGKALSSIEYLTDGGRDAEGAPEGGIARLLDAVPLLPATLAAAAGRAGAGSPPAQRAGRNRLLRPVGPSHG